MRGRPGRDRGAVLAQTRRDGGDAGAGGGAAGGADSGAVETVFVIFFITYKEISLFLLWGQY